MLLDLTFRVELDESTFDVLQPELANAVNELEYQHALVATLAIPNVRADSRDHILRGVLCGVCQSF